MLGTFNVKKVESAVIVAGDYIVSEDFSFGYYSNGRVYYSMTLVDPISEKTVR